MTYGSNVRYQHKEKFSRVGMQVAKKHSIT
jgi:hypothetical protein